MANKHELWELQSMQAAPLSVKVSLTKERIRQWVEHYGEDGVYVSFSGGKDSTVLLHIVREMYPNVPAVFVDVPTQYPELKEFAQTFDNVEIIKPKMSFMEVCEKYGFPLISKEVAECVYDARIYIKSMNEKVINPDVKTPYKYRYEKICGGGKYSKHTVGSDDNSFMFSCERYKFLLDAPFEIGCRCCHVMKKEPLSRYTRQTKRAPITAQMASESRLRTQIWLKQGCNAFDAKKAISNPMAFWTEQDVLLYIYNNKIPICSVYGEVVKENEIDGQLDFEDLGIFDIGVPLLKTTGCNRTGCMLCGFGSHLEKQGEGKFELLNRTHPKMYALLDVLKNNGVTMREAIDWTNEHGNLHIRY